MMAMPTLTFTLELDCPLDDLWAFHADVSRALPLLSPPDSDVRIIDADLPARVGQRVHLNVRGPLGKRLDWIAKIVAFDAPATSPDGRRIAGFVDEQLSGPMASWRHEHLMEELAPNRCRLTDVVTYRVSLGPLGRIADKLFVRRQITAMFRHRHEVTAQALTSVANASR